MPSARVSTGLTGLTGLFGPPAAPARGGAGGAGGRVPRCRAGGGAGEAAVSAVSVNPRTGRALLLFATPVDDLEAVLGAVISAAERAPLDEDASSPPGAGGAGGAGLARAHLGWDWLRVVAGGVAVAALTVVRLFGAPPALVRLRWLSWPRAPPCLWESPPSSAACARCWGCARRRSTP